MVQDAPSPEGDAEERRLIDRSAAGDQEAFRQLVLRHHRLVINVAFRALGELALAEDVAQDVFIKVYKHSVQELAKSAMAAGFRLMARRS